MVCIAIPLTSQSYPHPGSLHTLLSLQLFVAGSYSSFWLYLICYTLLTAQLAFSPILVPIKE